MQIRQKNRNFSHYFFWEKAWHFVNLTRWCFQGLATFNILPFLTQDCFWKKLICNKTRLFFNRIMQSFVSLRRICIRGEFINVFSLRAAFFGGVFWDRVDVVVDLMAAKNLVIDTPPKFFCGSQNGVHNSEIELFFSRQLFSRRKKGYKKVLFLFCWKQANRFVSTLCPSPTASLCFLSSQKKLPSKKVFHIELVVAVFS